MIPHFKSNREDKSETNKSFDINNTQLLSNNNLNNSNLSANKSIEKSRNNWDQNTFKKLRLTNSIQRSRKSLNSSIDSTNRRAIEHMTLAENLKALKPEIQIEEKKIEVNENNKNKKQQINENKNKILISDNKNKNEKEIDKHLNNRNKIIFANSRFSSNESNIIIENLGDIKIKRRVDEENDEVIHFNNDDLENKILLKFNKETIDFETSTKLVENNNNKNNIKKSKINENSNIFKTQKTEISNNNKIEDEEKIKYIDDDNASVNSKMSKVSESRRKMFEKSIKDVSVANKMRSNLSGHKKLTSNNPSKSKSLTKN
jgi:hypothetical protein